MIVGMLTTVSVLLLALVPAQCLEAGLVQVHVLARHGDRAPVPPLYPTDPHRWHHGHMSYMYVELETNLREDFSITAPTRT